MNALYRVCSVSCGLSLAILLALSSAMVNVPIRVAEAQQVPGADWKYVNYDKFATGFNPQTQITKDNIQFLEIKWIYPFPHAPASVGGYGPAGQGAISIPLVVDGVLYEVTNYGDVIAFEASTGKVVWLHTMKINRTEDLKKTLPILSFEGLGGGCC